MDFSKILKRLSGSFFCILRAGEGVSVAPTSITRAFNEALEEHQPVPN